MTTRPVDTSKRNLLGPIAHAVPMILVGACGPVLGGDGESTDTDPTNPTNPTDPTDPTELTESTEPPLPPPDCLVDRDCSPGLICSGGECVHDHDCSRLPPGYDVRCSPPWDCYDDSDCGSGEICDYGVCERVVWCGALPVLSQWYEITFSGGVGEVGALVHEPDLYTGLFVARGSVVERAFGAQGEIVAEAGASIRTIALGDVDGDGVADLLVVTDGIDGEVRLWHGEGAGFTATEFAQPIGGATVQLGIGDREGDGVPDVFARAGGDIVVFPGAPDAPLGPAQVVVGGEVSAFAMLGPSAPDAFAYAAGPLLRVVDGAGVVDLALAQSSSLSRIAVGAFTGPVTLDVVAHGGSPPGYIEAFDVLGAPTVRSELLVAPRALVAVGDTNRDGIADAAVSYSGSTVVSLQYGASLESLGGPFACETSFDFGFEVTHMALLDVGYDAELIVSDGVRVFVHRLMVYLE